VNTMLNRALIGWAFGMIIALLIASLFPLGFLFGVVVGAICSYGGLLIGAATLR